MNAKYKVIEGKKYETNSMDCRLRRSVSKQDMLNFSSRWPWEERVECKSLLYMWGKLPLYKINFSFPSIFFGGLEVKEILLLKIH